MGAAACCFGEVGEGTTIGEAGACSVEAARGHGAMTLSCFLFPAHLWGGSSFWNNLCPRLLLASSPLRLLLLPSDLAFAAALSLIVGTFFSSAIVVPCWGLPFPCLGVGGRAGRRAKSGGPGPGLEWVDGVGPGLWRVGPGKADQEARRTSWWVLGCLPPPPALPHH